MVKSDWNPKPMLPRTSHQKENEEAFSFFQNKSIACDANNFLTAIFFFFSKNLSNVSK